MKLIHLIQEGVQIDYLKDKINQLEQEWDSLDHSGIGQSRQAEISRELVPLRRELAKWEKIHSVVEGARRVPSVILGMVTPDFEVKAVKGYSDDAKHPPEWNRYSKWRYVPDMEMLGWWETPDPKEKEIVKDYLTSKGYKPTIHYVYNYIREEMKSTQDDVIYGGIKYGDSVVAHKVNPEFPSTANHTREMGRMRWVYYQSKQTVFWHSPVDDEDKETVENYLENRGYKVSSHRPMKDYYTVMAEQKLVMENKVSAQDLEKFISEMIRGSEWEGKVFAVGGFVRDEVMGKNPKDLDVVVNKHQGGIEFTNWLAKKLGIFKEGSNPVTFPSFGTANLRLDGVMHNGIDYTGEEIDAVMPRAEQYHDSSTRKPSAVQFTSLEDDAKRRDLTINAIYKNISTGEVFDPVNGVDDIKNKKIRTLVNPDLIYTDDALRMFRAVRFATQLGFELDPAIVDGIKRNLDRLGNTSKERIRDELNKILKTEHPDRGIKLLRDTGLLPYIAKELQGAVGMSQNVHHSEDVFDHTMTVLKKTKPELIQRLMALFHDVGKVVTRSETPTGVHFYGHEDAGSDIVEKIMRDLKYPSELINAVKLGVKNHMRLKSGGDTAVKLSDKALRKFKVEVGEHLENILDVMHADNIAHASASAMPNQIENVRKRLDNLNMTVKKPNLPIGGKDLMALGLKPGPIFSKIMSAVTDEWYGNPNISKEEAINIAKNIVGME